MTFHVFVTTPRAGFGRAVAPYTVELKETFATREEAQAFAAGKPLSAGAQALLDAMPSAYPEWEPGSIQSPITYETGAYRARNGGTWECRQPHTAAGDPNFAPGIALSLWLKVQPPGVSDFDAPVRYRKPTTVIDGPRAYDLVQPEIISQAHQRPSSPGMTAIWVDAGPASAVVPYRRASWWVVGSDEPDYTQVERAREV